MAGLKKPAKLILECDHCEARVNADFVACYEHFCEQDETSYRYYFAKCPVCGEPFVAISGNWGDWDDERHWELPVRYLPRANQPVSRSFPKNIAVAYSEAVNCFKAKAYTATAIICRKTLEGICAEHNIKKPNLALALRQMLDDGIIDVRLFEWADALRISGNEAAHGVEISFNREDIQDILDFTKALLEYVFTFRDKFEQFKERRSKK